MDSREFHVIRRRLGKSQVQLARLLGASLRAVQSFEQGWREVSAPVERQMLFLFYMKSVPTTSIRPCWDIRKCEAKTREKCPAREFKAGHICWFINGTICNGKIQESWNKKMQLCRQCQVFKSVFARLSYG
jgi:DNA-binding XRE family transcriptional regulator